MSTERRPAREYQDEALWGLLPEALSSLVHDLNNALVVLGGSIDVLDGSMQAAARAEVIHMRTSLAHLSLLSKPMGAEGERVDLFDLGSVIEGVESVLGPFARSLGIELRLPVRRDGSADRTGTILRGRRHAFERLVVLSVVAELVAMRDAGLARAEGHRARSGSSADGPVCALLLRCEGGGAALHLERTRRGEQDLGASACLARAFGESTALGLGMGMEFRADGDALVYAIDLSDSLAESTGTDRGELGDAERSVLLVGGDREEREAIAEFLSSEGFAVRVLERLAAAEELTAPRADLVLLDADLLGADTAVREALRADARLLACTLTLGAASPDEGPALPFVERPVRPESLLAAVRGRLRGGGRRSPA